MISRGSSINVKPITIGSRDGPDSESSASGAISSDGVSALQTSCLIVNEIHGRGWCRIGNDRRN